MFENLSAERKKLQKEGKLPSWYTTQAWQTFKKSYAVAGEEAVLGRFKTIAKTLSKHLPSPYAEKYEKRFFDLMWEGKLSPATPVLSNTGTNRGMPVSCSGQFIGNSIDSFYSNLRESALLSKYAFGTSGDFSSIVPRGTNLAKGGTANGVLPVIEDFFTCASKVSQGGVRRGSFAAYLDVEHADFNEVIADLIKNPSGKNIGWVIKDSFVASLLDSNKEALDKFKEIVYAKLKTGKGYLFFVDKANRHAPAMYKDKGLKVVASNLCSEIMLHSSNELTYSCVLSSVNLVHWNEIEKDDTIFDSVVFLDCVVSEFLEKSEGVAGLEKIREFTRLGRPIGLGVLGLHTYLQSIGVPFESLQAQFLDNQIFKRLHSETLRASKFLAELLGEPEWCKGYGVRNTHRTALAPTKSTAILMGGVSESTFPDPAAVFTAASSVGELSRIIPEFYKVLLKYGKYNDEVVNSIVNNFGSVQHLDFLTKEEKNVFKNAFEIDQEVILRRASLRQKYLCQGQSLNFYVPQDACETAVSKLISKAILDPDILSVYYAYSRSGVTVSDECIACQA